MAPASRFPSFMIYGPSGGGKTPQIGWFSRALFRETGGKFINDEAKGGLRLRLYSRDRGGYESILPEIETGLIQLVDLKLHSESPWIWTVKSIMARMPLKPGSAKWTKDPSFKDEHDNVIGAWAFEGLTEFGNALMHNMNEKRAVGINIGGGSVDMEVKEKDEENEDFSYAGHTRGDYMLCQDKIDNIINRSMRLPGYKIWTALDTKAADPTASRQIVGPDAGAGSKLTPKIPQKFTYTWRCVNLAKKGDDKPQYRLYLSTHQDPNTIGVTGVCNARYPANAPEDLKVRYIEPANMALGYIAAKTARDAAKAAMIKELS